MQFPFIHLHVHSTYSILDGMSSIAGLVEKSRKNGMNAIALTDHGNMFGVKEFFNYIKNLNEPISEKIKTIKKELKKTDDEEKIASLQEEIDKEKAKLFKPIIGCECYVARRGMLLKDKTNKEDRGGWHLILLAKNKKGYQNLCKLVSAAWVDGHYYKPRIDKELLEKYHEGLIVSTACLGGEIPQKLMGNFAKDVDEEESAQTGAEDLFGISEENILETEKSVKWFKNIFGNDFYLEIQRHKTDKEGGDTRVFKYQQIVNKAIIELGQRTDTKIIATNDVHFVEEEHADAHDRLICVSTNKDVDDPKRMRYTKQEWLKTPQEMWAIFADQPKVLENTIEVADKIELYSIDSDPIMPAFEIPEDFATEEEYSQKFSEKLLREEFDENFERLGGYQKVVRIKLEADYLEKLTYEGAAERYQNLNDEIRERIDYELNTIKSMGFPGYFLIVQDFISVARKMGVFVGPGRGSAAGSVVAYCLKIHNIDPFKYDLLFERFLNPDRINLPDIDIDFDDDGRNKILQWVTDKYGKERVAHIITYGTMATKSSIKDVARVQKLPLSESNRLTKLIPDKFPEDCDGNSAKVNLTNVFKLVPEMRAELSSPDPNIVTTLKFAEMLEGTVRQTGVHASGIIIAADDLTNFVPVSIAVDTKTGQEALVTQYEGAVIEDVGLIKMDFLGLKTLSIIKETLQNIKKSKNIDLDIETIPFDDPKTYKLYSTGRTVGTFQFESDGMRKYLRDLKPSKFEDLIAMNALYRPGPMNYIPKFINRKLGREAISYDLPLMEKRLQGTYGVTVYQEQVMLLSRDIADFTRGQSDELRKAMGKKDKKKMASLKKAFLEGAQKKGYGPLEKLEKIWNDWAEFAKYGFNKSHSTCYSYLAYQTAYLKANFPAEYMAASLTRNRDNITEISKFMDECKAMGINVLSPDVNESDLNFTVTQKGHIRFGLGGIKGVGEGAAIAIISEREQNGKFNGIFDFIERCSLTIINKRVLESLALSGAFDGLNIRREQLFEKNPKTDEASFIETLIKYGNKFQTDKLSSQISLFGGNEAAVQIVKPEIPRAEEWSVLKKLNAERELIGIYLSAHPLDSFEFEIKYICNTKTTELNDLQAIANRQLKIGGIITAVRHATTKTGNPCGFFTIEDYDGAFEVALFGKNYPEFRNYMIKDAYVMISAKVQPKGADFSWKNKYEPPSKELELKIQRIDLLENVRADAVRNLTITIPYQKIDDDFVAALTQQITENKGNTNLYLKIYDQLQSRKQLSLFSRQYRISINHDFFQFLKYFENQEVLEFSAG